MSSNLSDLREIPLALVMERMGATPDPADPKRNFLHPAGRITVTENKFYNHTQGKGGGGAIDLAMHLSDLNFKQAIAWLSQEAGKEETINQYKLEARKHVEQIAKGTLVPKLDVPAKNDSRLPQVIEYLHLQRGLPLKIINHNINQGNLWADKNGNCVFALRNDEGNIVGAEIRGTYSKPFHGTRGQKANAFFYTGSNGTSDSKKIAFTESAIEAMSYQALHGDTLVVGTNGTRREAVIALIKRLEPKGYKPILAFNNDKPGRKLAENISNELTVKHDKEFPSVKDWNDQLLANRAPHRNMENSAEKTRPKLQDPNR